MYMYILRYSIITMNNVTVQLILLTNLPDASRRLGEIH